jgi:hypothetical protein
MNTISPNSFDRGKPFYPLIMNFIVQLIGFKEMATQGITGRRSIDEVMSQFREQLGGSDQELALLRASIESVMGSLELRSEFSNSSIKINMDEIANEVAQNSKYLAESLSTLLVLFLSSRTKFQRRSPGIIKTRCGSFCAIVGMPLHMEESFIF